MEEEQDWRPDAPPPPKKRYLFGGVGVVTVTPERYAELLAAEQEVATLRECLAIAEHAADVLKEQRDTIEANALRLLSGRCPIHTGTNMSWTHYILCGGDGCPACLTQERDRLRDRVIAHVALLCGRYVLRVGGVSVAMETDLCRDDLIADRLWAKGSLEEAAARINAALAVA